MANRSIAWLLVAGSVLLGTFAAVAQECPEFVGEIQGAIGFTANEVAASGEFLYVGTDVGLLVFRRVGPRQFDRIGWIGLPEPAQDLEVSSGYIYVAAGASGLRVIDVRDPEEPLEVGYFEPSDGAFSRVAIFGRTAFVIDPVLGMRLIDVTDPYSPFEIGSCHEPELRYQDVTAIGRHAYITGRTHDWHRVLQVVDVSSPPSLFEVGSYSTQDGHRYKDLAVAGGFAYTSGAWSHGIFLIVIDVRIPSGPVEVSREVFGDDHFTGIAASNGLVFLTSNHVVWGRLRIFDATDPSSLSILGSAGAADRIYFNGVAVSGRYVYIAVGNNGVRVYDVLGCVPSDSHQETHSEIR